MTDIIKPTDNRNVLWVVDSLETDLEFKTVLLNCVNILKYNQSPNQCCLEHFQGRDIHSFLGQPVAVPHHPL